MGSGLWFKNIISKKILKRHSAPPNINGFKECHVMGNGACVDSQGMNGLSIEDAAATRIQTAYRSYLVRKTFHQMKGMVRLRNLVKCDFVKKQASTTLSHLHSWSRIQAQIRERRVHMVTEGRLKQKKAENQIKLDAKLNDLEVEWSGGCDTMDRALSRIHQRAEASIKRERAMAYAFSHQWRANSNPSFGSENQELKENWGWSWTDRWIAVRPWETRVPTARQSPKKANKTSKDSISLTSKIPGAKVKLISPNGKASRKARKLSFEPADCKPTTPKMKATESGEKVKNQQDGC